MAAEWLNPAIFAQKMVQKADTLTVGSYAILRKRGASCRAAEP